jgi:hypothetical protein
VSSSRVSCEVGCCRRRGLAARGWSTFGSRHLSTRVAGSPGLWANVASSQSGPDQPPPELRLAAMQQVHNLAIS